MHLCGCAPTNSYLQGCIGCTFSNTYAQKYACTYIQLSKSYLIQKCSCVTVKSIAPTSAAGPFARHNTLHTLIKCVMLLGPVPFMILRGTKEKNYSKSVDMFILDLLQKRWQQLHSRFQTGKFSSKLWWSQNAKDCCIYLFIYFQGRKFSLKFQGTFGGHFGHWQAEKETNVKQSPFHTLTLTQNCGISKRLSGIQLCTRELYGELFSLGEDVRLGFRSALKCNHREWDMCIASLYTLEFVKTRKKKAVNVMCED